MRRSGVTAAVMAVAVGLTGATAASSSADTNVALAPFGTTIYTADINDFGDTLEAVPISGFGNDRIFGLDVRPATGQLVALTEPSSQVGQVKLYNVNLETGTASLLANTGTFTTGAGVVVGFDFNPVFDRARVTVYNTQNIRYNPNTGAATFDSNLAYAPGDPNFGTSPFVTRSAHTNSFLGAGSSTLYDIDTQANAVVIQDPANNGTLHTFAPLGFDAVNEDGGFDIVHSGESVNSGFATLNPAGSVPQGLYTVRPSDGRVEREESLASLPNIRSLAIVGDLDD